MFRGILTKRTTSNSDYRKSEEKENLVVNSNTNSNGNGNGGEWFTERGAKFVPVPVGVAVAQYGPNPPRVPSRANANETMNSGVGVGERGMGLEDRERVLEVKTMDRAFDKLLDDLQIPPTLRPRLAGIDTPIKAAMLRSSRQLASTSTLSTLSTTLTAAGEGEGREPRTPRTLRKTRSSEGFESPRNIPLPSDLNSPFGSGGGGTPRKRVMSRPTPPTPSYIPTSASASPTASPHTHANRANIPTHARGVSLDFPRIDRAQSIPIPLALEPTSTSKPATAKTATTFSKAKSMRDWTPEAFCSLLNHTSIFQLEVEAVKKLRLLLRNESAGWSEKFLKTGGYAALLTRLNEILEVEWREEQHDDQILHELLRCFKALSTSSIGCFALRSSCPTPFVQLVSLLYSDKKPGDICSRQLIVDLLLILLDLYPPSSYQNPIAFPSSSSSPSRASFNGSSSSPTTSSLTITSSSTTIPHPLPLPHTSPFSLLRALLLTPRPLPSESPSTPISPHAFIASLHSPRIYKTYLGEVSDICRDYFWVFCHPNNGIWELGSVDEGRVERPRAPGGMTGGVEWEAMGYLTTHLKLLNAICEAAAALNMPPDHELSALRLHADLFASGLERIILTTRKASTAYYPTLHLEVARYVALAGRARFEIPWGVARLVGPPPAGVAKGHPSGHHNGSKSAPGSPSRAMKRDGRPMLPSPRKLEPIVM
ncbi:hypothetical protein SISSUDRAFT_1042398 [Sistotremastrum suecicum HHB10207 ss-3]|uniref:Formin GTPase-binding domain-containing protein n=1 Tax=Sistotremastrum suecicum HHB10207 ss-3 TaxID=1314776 RepID=A0A166GNM5_9AGAM|nr:hypothetical protein SISSUDRAFT_1042398 [Sistotremastrum suecicum HHB10207 ss-3]